MFISKTLTFYKRKDVQEAILKVAEDKEIAIKYGHKGFGKRPDVLQYNNDILEYAKKGMTSLHCSEENWYNPLQITTGMKPAELNSLRKGWDLVLDIDCPDWTFSKLTAHLVVKALKDHKISSISAKFSGNKGFHIAVPFESFPKSVGGIETRTLFPEAPRKIAYYLMKYISNKYISINKNKISFDEYTITIKELENLFPIKKDELIQIRCKECNAKVDSEEKIVINFVCSCGNSIIINKPQDHLICPRCNKLMERIVNQKTSCKCGTNKHHIFEFNPLAILEVDTILIASRHLFRMPYSFHEKSELISIPINPESILSFEKTQAEFNNVQIKHSFLSRDKVVPGEASSLLTNALDFEVEIVEQTKENKPKREFDELTEAIPESSFPPCIHRIFQGLEDGKKRSLFILTNFLANVGWGKNEIETRLHEWNEKNLEPLREVNIKGHVRYHLRDMKKKVLPPNCPHATKGANYYSDINLCHPDNLCNRIKNPVQYAKIKSRDISKNSKKKISEKSKTVDST